MSTDVLPPAPLIDLSQYTLASLKDLAAVDDSVLADALARVIANAEDEDVLKICAFNSAI